MNKYDAYLGPPLIADEKHKKFKHQQNNNSYKDELEMAMSRTELPKTGTAVSSQKYIVLQFLLLYTALFFKSGVDYYILILRAMLLVPHHTYVCMELIESWGILGVVTYM